MADNRPPPVTDAMVEAGARVMATRRGHKDCDALITTTDAGQVPVWKFYTEEPHAILEAAAKESVGRIARLERQVRLLQATLGLARPYVSVVVAPDAPILSIIDRVIIPAPEPTTVAPICDCAHPKTTPSGFAAISMNCPIHGDDAS